MPQPGKRPAEDAWLRAKVHRYSGDADAALEAYTQASLQDPNDFYIAKDYGLYLEELGQAQTADVQLRRAYRMNSRDQEVAAALTRLGTVPGPALKEKKRAGEAADPARPDPAAEDAELRLRRQRRRTAAGRVAADVRAVAGADGAGAERLSADPSTGVPVGSRVNPRPAACGFADRIAKTQAATGSTTTKTHGGAARFARAPYAPTARRERSAALRQSPCRPRASR